MERKEKPKYHTVQNVFWMIRQGWKTQKAVLLICVLSVVLEVSHQLIQLYIAPEILQRVESHVPMGELLATILTFTVLLFATVTLKGYVRQNAMFPKIDVRCKIIAMLGQKSMLTSYPNTLRVEFKELQASAGEACGGNHQPAELIWDTMIQLAQNVLGLVVYLVILRDLDWRLMAVVLATCVLGFFAPRYTNHWIFAHREEDSRYYARKSYICDKAEAVTLAKDVRIFGLQNWLLELLDQVHNTHLDFQMKVERKRLLADLSEVVLTLIRNGIAYLYLVNQVLAGQLSVPEFLLCFTAVTTLTTWVMGVLHTLSALQENSMGISRIREFLEYPEEFRFTGGIPIPKQGPYELKLEQVSFRYPGAEADTISNLNLTIHPGEKLAIVGLNGAGKSTLVKLLCGLFDPTEGRVLLNGVDIREFNRMDYYQQFSAVFQDFSVLSATVAENIAQSVNYDPERVAACIEKAGLKDMVEALPRGVETNVGRDVYLDGVLFSGGQTQRLMLARALYKDGPILMLDEPTAALDPIAENDIYMHYNDMTTGKTSLFISHRLASTRFCDRIIFVADGRIVEEGTHESLLAQGGAYAELFEIQSRYYQEGKEF